MSSTFSPTRERNLCKEKSTSGPQVISDTWAQTVPGNLKAAFDINESLKLG